MTNDEKLEHICNKACKVGASLRMHPLYVIRLWAGVMDCSEGQKLNTIRLCYTYLFERQQEHTWVLPPLETVDDEKIRPIKTKVPRGPRAKELSKAIRAYSDKTR